MSIQRGAKINSKVPLVCAAVVSGVFGLSMLLSPLGFLSQYDISVSHMSQADSMLVATTCQQFGIWMLMTAGWCSIACRVASEQTRMHLNLAGALSWFVNFLLTLLGFGAFTRVGTSVSGLVFNLCLGIIMMVLFGLGSSLHFELAPIKKPIYWGSSVMALVGFTYSLGFLLFPETLFNGYHLSFDENRVRVLMLACLHYGWSGLFFQMSVWLVAGMMTTDFMYIYALNRYIAMIECGMCLVSATNMAWWNTKNEHGDLDNFIAGQWSNFIMAFTFLLLTYVPIAMIDTQIARAVNEAIGGAPDGAPTLLAQGSQQKSGFKEPLMA